MIDGVYRWLQFSLNTLGDTELEIYTNDPGQIELTLPDSIPLGNTSPIIIQTGVPFSQVCIHDNDKYYFVGKTDPSGDLYFVPSPITYNPLIITTTAHNMIYATDTLNISEPEGPVIVIQNHQITAGDDQDIEYCESVSGEITLMNIGSDTAYNCELKADITDDYFVNNSDDVWIGDIPPGENVIVKDAFAFDVDCYVPDCYSVELEIQIEGHNIDRKARIDLTAFAPNIIAHGAFAIAGENHFLSQGDSTLILVEVRNEGGADASNVRAFISSEGGDFILYDYADTTYTQLNAGEFASLHYGIYNSEGVGSVIPIIHEMNADYFTTVNTYYFPVIDSLENFETGDFTLYPWDLSKGDAEWVIDSMHAYNGRFCAKTGAVSPGQTSILQLELEIINDGQISFFKRTSDLTGMNNFFEFYIDSVMMGVWPGYMDWSQEIFRVSQGMHLFEWKYMKNVHSPIDTADCAWIDYISFPECRVASNAIEEPGLENANLIIYPNPNNGMFNLLPGFSLAGSTSIDIYNLHGQIVFHKELVDISENSIYQINSGDIANGIYLIRISNEKYTLCRKLLIN